MAGNTEEIIITSQLVKKYVVSHLNNQAKKVQNKKPRITKNLKKIILFNVQKYVMNYDRSAAFFFVARLLLLVSLNVDVVLLFAAACVFLFFAGGS